MNPLLFESKYWWKEVGIILFLFVGIGLVMGLVEIFIITFYYPNTDELYPGYIYELVVVIFVFFTIWNTHKIAVKKKDNEYQLFQSNEWWKEFLVIIGLLYLLWLLPEYFILRESIDEYSTEYFIFVFLLKVIIIIFGTWAITWFLHRIAVENQKRELF